MMIYENRGGALNESSLIDNDAVDAGVVEAENLSLSGSGQDWRVRCNVVDSKRRRLKCLRPAVFGGRMTRALMVSCTRAARLKKCASLCRRKGSKS